MCFSQPIIVNERVGHYSMVRIVDNYGRRICPGESYASLRKSNQLSTCCFRNEEKNENGIPHGAIIADCQRRLGDWLESRSACRNKGGRSQLVTRPSEQQGREQWRLYVQSPARGTAPFGPIVAALAALRKTAKNKETMLH